jgi:hypothetical protein
MARVDGLLIFTRASQRYAKPLVSLGDIENAWQRPAKLR